MPDPKKLSTAEIKSEEAKPMPAPVKPNESKKPEERGGPPGPEPTRYGDWEKNGKCVDF